MVHDGRHYDSKAIAGVAHRHSVGEILKASSFSRGRSQTVPALIRLGFRIIDTGSTQQRAWLVASKQTYRRLAGGDTYDDHVATHYSWDSNVANSRQIRAGDLVAVWDESELLGASVIESIELSRGPKSMGRCPERAKVNIARRVTMKPVFRCDDCKHTFDVPTVTESMVDKFKSTHGQGWIDLAGTLGRDELLELRVVGYSQNSVRELRLADFVEAVGLKTLGSPMTVVQSTNEQIRGGHAVRMVRVRLGQPSFRAMLIRNHGEVCAFTGPAPAAVLDAAHLYSYAKVGEHHDDGGILLRRDLHTLFDRGLISVNEERKMHVADEIRSYSAYSALHDVPLHANLSKSQLRWLAAHREQWEGAN